MEADRSHKENLMAQGLSPSQFPSLGLLIFEKRSITREPFRPARGGSVELKAVCNARVLRGEFLVIEISPSKSKFAFECLINVLRKPLKTFFMKAAASLLFSVFNI